VGESTKAVLALVFIVATMAAAVAWFHDQPDPTVWGFRFGAAAVSLAALGFLLKLNFRRDRENDYLRQVNGNYFNRGGFCFSFVPRVADGVCWFDAYFQNQYDRPCRGRIALRPGRGFFLTRAAIETVVWEVECGPAAFGVARVPVPVGPERQGKKQPFEVGASVEYPEGHGSRVRFHDGLFLRKNADFGDAFTTSLAVAGLVAGGVVMSKPATWTLTLPTGVAEAVPPFARPEVVTFWKLGDPPLTSL